jgi:hypothetical protein
MKALDDLKDLQHFTASGALFTAWLFSSSVAWVYTGILFRVWSLTWVLRWFVDL